MERILTPDEKIKKIEEIYYNKKIQANNQNRTRVNISEKNNEKTKKIVIKILICITLYIIFLMIKNFNYPFSTNIINKTKEILSYDINFGELYSKTPKIKKENEETNIVENTEKKEEGKIEETLSVTDTSINEIPTQTLEEVSSSISQMNEDLKQAKKQCSFIKPLEGTITSRYGTREETNSIVSPYHTGIDIAQNLGTPFMSAISGTVKSVSSEGGYRKTYSNSKWRCFYIICTL